MTDSSGPIDVESLVAIDVHVHVEQDSQGCLSLDRELLDASAKYFKASDERTPTVAHLADYYRSRHIAAVIFTVDATIGLGHPALSSEEIAELAAAHDDVLIPFGSVDPLSGERAVTRATSLAEQHGVEMPIAREVYKVCHKGATARQAFRGLLRHRPGSEHEVG